MSQRELITLNFPLENGMKELKMRRAKVRDMLASDKITGTDAEKEITLFANLCEVTPDDIQDLDMVDYQQVQDKYKSFLSLAPKKPGLPA